MNKKRELREPFVDARIVGWKMNETREKVYIARYNKIITSGECKELINILNRLESKIKEKKKKYYKSRLLF